MVVMEAEGLVIWGGDVQGNWVLEFGKIWGSVVSGIFEDMGVGFWVGSGGIEGRFQGCIGCGMVG